MNWTTHAVYSSLDLVQNHEYEADNWAVHRIIPPDTLMTELKDGYAETRQLAEKFEVTELFLQRALYIYHCEGLNAKLAESSMHTPEEEQPEPRPSTTTCSPYRLARTVRP